MKPSLLLRLIPMAAVVGAVACGSSTDSMSALGDSNAGDPSGAMNASASPSDRNAAPASGETYGALVENDWVDTSTEPTSTFGIDVDTGSYSIMRRDLGERRLPVPQSVRTEEYINYFDYGYAPPTDDKPFAVHLAGAPSYFGEGFHLFRVALQGKTVIERKRANLVFLVDVSGSMDAPKKLPLVKYTLTQLIERLQPTDTLGIVTYAGSERTLLEPTAVTNKAAIVSAIEGLVPNGGTNGEGGIRKAYQLAEKMKGLSDVPSINRVILCTDGDFNVGLTGDALIQLIEQERDKGVTLTTLGYGSGNYNDYVMESLADHGNGNYAYIDDEAEATRVLGKRLVSTLQVIAKDAKIQVELDPTVVRRYRLVGYENSVMKNEDFEDDKKDSGELGAGHSVTAFYEIELTPEAKSGSLGAAAAAAKVRLRYKEPEGTVSTELETAAELAHFAASFDAAPPDFRFAAATAELAEILRRSKHSEGARFAEVAAIAEASANGSSERSELVSLVRTAGSLWQR